jgi:nitrite reductase/ring-hydroxylating ferredoxin subunit
MYRQRREGFRRTGELRGIAIIVINAVGEIHTYVLRCPHDVIAWDFDYCLPENQDG